MEQGPDGVGRAGEAGPHQPEPVADSHGAAEEPTSGPQSVAGVLSSAKCKWLLLVHIMAFGC